MATVMQKIKDIEDEVLISLYRRIYSHFLFSSKVYVFCLFIRLFTWKIKQIEGKFKILSFTWVYLLFRVLSDIISVFMFKYIFLIF